MGNDTLINIEVSYALPDEQIIIPLQVNSTTTIQQAIEQSGILTSNPEIDLSKNKTGIFSKIAPLDKILNADDRVEIYRPLIADPKEVRKQRAMAGKVMKKGAKSIS